MENKLKNKKKILIISALLWPVIIWAIVVGIKTHAYYAGVSLILPVQGYDPRDLLSGHYIIYRVDYGAPLDCTADIYLDERMFVHDPGQPWARLETYPPPEGSLYIAGYCKNRRFIANIERYYVPEDKAFELDKVLRNREVPAAIEIAVGAGGSAQVKAFMLNRKPWQDALKELKTMEESKP